MNHHRTHRPLAPRAIAMILALTSLPAASRAELIAGDLEVRERPARASLVGRAVVEHAEQIAKIPDHLEALANEADRASGELRRRYEAYLAAPSDEARADVMLALSESVRRLSAAADEVAHLDERVDRSVGAVRGALEHEMQATREDLGNIRDRIELSRTEAQRLRDRLKALSSSAELEEALDSSAPLPQDLREPLTVLLAEHRRLAWDEASWEPAVDALEAHLVGLAERDAEYAEIASRTRDLAHHARGLRQSFGAMAASLKIRIELERRAVELSLPEAFFEKVATARKRLRSLPEHMLGLLDLVRDLPTDGARPPEKRTLEDSDQGLKQILREIVASPSTPEPNDSASSPRDQGNDAHRKGDLR